ncbi:MAG: ATP-binding protein [Acidobacteriota bacterium]
MIRTLTGRLVVSYVGLTIALNVLLFFFLGFAMKRSLEQGVSPMLIQLVEAADSFEDAVLEFSSEFGHEGEHLVEESYFRVFEPGGSIAFAQGPEVPLAEGLVEGMARGDMRSDTVGADGGESRLQVVSRRLSDGGAIQAGVLLKHDHALFREFRRYWNVSLFILIVLAAILGWWMAQSATRGVKEVSRTAERILKGGSLSARVPEHQQVQEVKQLTATINGMLERIDGLVTSLRFVTVDAAHDFRSPLTRIRGAAEVALRGDESMEGYREMAVRAIEETSRLEAIVETMLEIVRLDIGREPPQPEEVDLASTLEEVVDLYQDSAESKGIYMTLKKEPGSYHVRADRTVLQRVFANIVDNAVKFTPLGGSIHLDIYRDTDEKLMICVSDSGPGIPEEELSHVFERFYRVDRSRGTPGHGLGLSYVHAAMTAHGGEIRLRNRAEGGTRVELWFRTFVGGSE